MPRGRSGGKGKGSGPKSIAGNDADAFMRDLIRRMDGCETAEKLNDEVLMPFALALEKVALARGYLLNIYGEASNIAVTSDEDAETIYHLIEEYLDQKD